MQELINLKWCFMCPQLTVKVCFIFFLHFFIHMTNELLIKKGNDNMGILNPLSYTLGLYLYVTLYMMVSRTFFTNVQLPVCVYPRS